MRRNLRVVTVLSLALLVPAGVARAQTKGAAGAPGTAAPPPAAPAAAPAARSRAALLRLLPAPAPVPAAPATTTPAPAPAPAAPATTTPAPAPPAKLNLTATPPAEKPAANTAPGATLSPNLPTIGGDSRISPRQAETLTATTSGAADEWKFEFHGYFRAPAPRQLRPAVAHRTAQHVQPDEPEIRHRRAAPCRRTRPAPAARPRHCSGTARRASPASLYTTWEFTNTVHGPWTQLNFSYGNSRATATVIINSYSVTDGGYRHLQAQQGIEPGVPDAELPRGARRLGAR